MMTHEPDDMLKAMTCSDIKALLSAVVDDEVDGETRHEIERHLGDCRECRALVDRVEAVDALVRADVEALAASATISPGFEAAVLNRTVFSSRRSVARRRWISWSGWLAAAASLGLAVTVWVADRQPGHRGAAPYQGEVIAAGITHESAGASSAWLKRSTIYEGELPGPRLPGGSSAAPTGRPGGFGVAGVSGMSGVSGAVMDAVSSSPAPVGAGDMAPADALAGTAALAIARPEVVIEDVDAVASAALLVRMLADADVASFADVEQVRRIAEFDEVLDRLSQVKPRLPDREQPMLMAAEGLLLRAVRGPLSMDDLAQLRADVTRLRLADELDVIASRLELARSL